MMIDRNNPLPVTKQAPQLGINRGSVYYLPRPNSQADLALMRQIYKLHLQYPHMSPSMLVRQLQRLDIQVGRVHVRTLSERMGICALAAQAGASQPAPGHNVYPYLLRNAAITQANQVWALDTAYIPVERGSQIVNTDQDNQFTASESNDVVLRSSYKISMDGRGTWRNNVFVERLWRIIKYALVYKRACDGVSDARAKITSYIYWHNRSCTHSSLDDQTPDTVCWARAPKVKLAA